MAGSFPNTAPVSGVYPLPVNFSTSIAASDINNGNDSANYAWRGVDSAPTGARVATTGAETYTIVSGSVTTINGTAIDAVSVAVNDVILVKDAPASSGVGSALSSQPGNGLYYVTAIGANISVSRCATMSTASSQPNPAGRIVFVRRGGATNPSTMWQVVNPYGVAAFTWGTTALQWGVVVNVDRLSTATIGATKLVSIGDQGFGSSLAANAVSTAGTGETMFTVGVAATGITAAWQHWYTHASTFLDVDPAGSISFNASLKVVSSTNPGTTTGTIYRLTFNGRTTATLDPGGRITADLLGLSLAVGDVVAIRTYLSSGTAYAARYVYGTVSGGGFTSSGDLTAPGSAAITASAGLQYGPAALLGHADSASTAKSVLLLGDSIAAAAGDNALFSLPALGVGGFAIRALSGVTGLVNAGVSGDLATIFVSSGGSQRRLSHANRCNTAIIEYGSNDLAGGISAATLQAALLNIAKYVRRLGISKAFLTTIVPRTTSTDSWTTTVNQTTLALESQRVIHNTWVRAGCPIDPTTLAAVTVGTSGALLAGSFGHPITGVFDTASKVESSLNSGFWLPPGRVVTGSMTSGLGTLTSSTANFQTAIQELGGDKGAWCFLFGAGAAGAVLSTLITSVSSGTLATILGVASTTVTNQPLAINVTTVDGIHPAARGHTLMSTAINTSLL